MEIDLFGDPPTVREIEAERAELENSKLLIEQNEAHVAGLYRKLLIKSMIISVILVLVILLYFILPAGMLGMVNGRAVILITVSIMLFISLLWIVWRTWIESRSTLPGRSHSIQQRQRLQKRMDALADIDVKQRLNVVNWSRMDGVLTEYLKKITRLRRHLIGMEYAAIKLHVKKTASR
jgi:hypothetical protein